VAFERFADSYGVKILKYHADNGRFAENVWKQAISEKNQQLTFSGVGAHHQNGRAEKRIRDIQDLARTSIIHAHRRWPSAVDNRLWPYALRHANHALNNTQFPGEEKTPLEKFSRTDVAPNLDHHHPFGCPAYALDGRIRSGMKGPKWENQARLAINLGPSPQHAKTVGLLLSLTTGLVSPQFHVRYDDGFDTVRQTQSIVSNWQHLAGFELFRKPKLLPVTTSAAEAATIPVTENEPAKPCRGKRENR
jgi:hypothetical protein